ncbi:hypothetical protein Glove_543g35 [Diversispora epigaea]|uniref:Protein kinase domain-containing protein n=1 Tax=Diversispora epigaea TaxID=1348612 RepID=A0A397GCC9_9GLOM|nr:hypothetical protein Glove_543g35 [Diversispora epigaea]
MATHDINWNEKLRNVWYKSGYSIDRNIHKTITEQEEYRKNMIENDSSLSENEKKFLLNEILKLYDKLRIDNSSVEKQQCNNCRNWHRATQYCELCIRKYLENNFGNWTSGNNEIDKLIQECQQKTISPNSVIEWIEYDQFENIEHLTEGGCATIYTATWKDGGYDKWNSVYRTLERFGRQKIVLKRLNNSNNNNVHWFQEVNTYYYYVSTQYCELCIRKYLENNFGNWTSGNNEIDKLIQECQQKTISPNSVIEWIEYDQFENIEHLTEGGCATIYTATWKDGGYDKWNSVYRTLERFGRQKIVLKRLNNSNNNNVHWFQEVTLSFTLDNSLQLLAVCYGLTKDPTTQDYILVLDHYDNNLRHFLKDNYHSLSLLQKHQIIYKVASSLDEIHQQNTIHRDLHSGNILYYEKAFFWYISDLGLSGPVDKPLNSIYGNLPYIAPEVLCGEIYTKKSDIYSMGILMWEVITGETPLDDYEHDLELTIDIVKGCRPKVCEYIPHEYATLMKQCWDANPDNRPDARTVYKKMGSLIWSLYNEANKQQENIENIQSKNFKSKIKNFFKLKSKKDKNNQVIINAQLCKNIKSKICRIQTSKVYTFNISIKSRNATDEDQLAFDSKLIDFEISEEMQQQYLKSIGVNNSNKFCDDQEFGIAGPSNSVSNEIQDQKINKTKDEMRLMMTLIMGLIMRLNDWANYVTYDETNGEINDVTYDESKKKIIIKESNTFISSILSTSPTNIKDKL